MNPIRPPMIIITVWVLLFAILSSCSSSQQEIDKAVKQTVEARVISPQPSSTPTSTLESNQVIISQLVATPSTTSGTLTPTDDLQSLIIGNWETIITANSNENPSSFVITMEIEFTPDGYAASALYDGSKYPFGVEDIPYKIVQSDNGISHLVINNHPGTDSADRIVGVVRMPTTDTLIIESVSDNSVQTYHRHDALSVSSVKKTPIGSWISSSGGLGEVAILDFYENGDFVLLFFNSRNLMDHNTEYGKFELLNNNQVKFVTSISKSSFVSEYSLHSQDSLVVKNFLDSGKLTFRRLEAKQVNTDLLRKALLGKWESDEIKALDSDSKNKSTFEFVEDGTVTYNGKGVGRYTFVEPDKIELTNIVLSSLAKDETFTLRLYILSDYRLLLVSEVTSNGTSIFLPPFYKK